MTRARRRMRGDHRRGKPHAKIALPTAAPGLAFSLAASQASGQIVASAHNAPRAQATPAIPPDMINRQ